MKPKSIELSCSVDVRDFLRFTKDGGTVLVTVRDHTADAAGASMFIDERDRLVALRDWLNKVLEET